MTRTKKILTLIYLLVALDGILVVGYEYINKKILIAYDDMSVDIFMKENKEVVVEEENKTVTKEKEIKVEVQETKTVETKKEIYNYVAILEKEAPWSSWDIVRGPVFPIIIFLSDKIFGKTSTGILVLLFLRKTN